MFVFFFSFVVVEVSNVYGNVVREFKVVDMFCSVFDLMNWVLGCFVKLVERGKRREVIGFFLMLLFWNCGLYGVIEGERKLLCFLD